MHAILNFISLYAASSASLIRYIKSISPTQAERQMGEDA